MSTIPSNFDKGREKRRKERERCNAYLDRIDKIIAKLHPIARRELLAKYIGVTLMECGWPVINSECGKWQAVVTAGYISGFSDLRLTTEPRRE